MPGGEKEKRGKGDALSALYPKPGGIPEAGRPGISGDTKVFMGHYH